MHTFSGSLEECAQKPQMAATWTLETLKRETGARQGTELGLSARSHWKEQNQVLQL